MSRLEYWQKKIQEKRKQTPWREFVKEIASRQQLTFHKVNNKISRYPDTERIGSLVEPQEFIELMGSNHNMREIDEHEPFFVQRKALFETASLPRLWQALQNENTSFADTIGNTRNIYLTTAASFDAENVMYSYEVSNNVRDIVSSVAVLNNSQTIFLSTMVTNSFKVFYSTCIDNSSHIRFSSNLSGCSECLLCHGLVNQSYCIENRAYEKEEYFRKKEELLRNKNDFETYWGDALDNFNKELTVRYSEGVENGLFVTYTKQGRNIIFCSSRPGEEKESLYDVFSSGSALTDAYACMGVSPGSQIYCSMNSMGTHLFYCYYMDNCSYCLGCIGLQNKSFCIFNKQYEKEEWFERVDQIFSEMEEEGTLGEFFPGGMNPFYFNDTAAYLIDDSFTKEEVEAEGYLWRDNEIKVDIPEWMEVVKVEELDKYEGYDELGNWKIDPSILKKVIKDEEENIYRVIKMEYDFLMKHELPLPRKHWLERLKVNFKGAIKV